MNRFLKFLFRFFLLLIIISIGFFFWASSATLDKNEYAKLTTNKSINNTTNSDSIYSIVTYNIGYLSGLTNSKPIEKSKKLFDDNLHKVLIETTRIQPDIIAFQEIDYDASRSYNINQQNEIAKLGYSYIAESVNWDETYIPFPYWPPSTHFGKVVSGQSILSKYPIKEHERIVLDRDKNLPFYRSALYLDRLAQVVKIELEGKEVVVINVHLEAFDKSTRVKQFNFVVDLFNKYRKTNPTILLGDFNSETRNQNAIIHTLLNTKDVGCAGFSKENPENTYNTKEPSKRIDYIFYSKKSIKSINGKVLTSFGQASDHYPLLMRFRLK